MFIKVGNYASAFYGISNITMHKAKEKNIFTELFEAAMEFQNKFFFDRALRAF